MLSAAFPFPGICLGTFFNPPLKGDDHYRIQKFCNQSLIHSTANHRWGCSITKMTRLSSPVRPGRLYRNIDRFYLVPRHLLGNVFFNPPLKGDDHYRIQKFCNQSLIHSTANHRWGCSISIKMSTIHAIGLASEVDSI